MGTPARQCHVGKPPMETRLRATDTAADRDCRSFHAYSRRKTSKTCRPRPSFKHELFDELFPRRCKIGDSNFSSEKKIPRGLLMWFYNDRKVLASRFKITRVNINSRNLQNRTLSKTVHPLNRWNIPDEWN